MAATSCSYECRDELISVMSDDNISGSLQDDAPLKSTGAEESVKSALTVYRTYSRRWLILLAVSLLNFSNAMVSECHSIVKLMIILSAMSFIFYLNLMSSNPNFVQAPSEECDRHQCSFVLFCFLFYFAVYFESLLQI